MPGVFNLSVDEALREAEEAASLGLGGLLLFGLPESKDEEGTGAWDENGIVQQGLRALKRIRSPQRSSSSSPTSASANTPATATAAWSSKTTTASPSKTIPPSICSPAPPSAWPRPEPTLSPPAT